MVGWEIEFQILKLILVFQLTTSKIYLGHSNNLLLMQTLILCCLKYQAELLIASSVYANNLLLSKIEHEKVVTKVVTGCQRAIKVALFVVETLSTIVAIGKLRDSV